MTWLLAIVGLALALYGLALFAAFAAAHRVFARVQKSETFGRVQQSGAVRVGDDLARRAIEAIPSRFARRLITRWLGGDASAFGLSMIDDRLRGGRSLGGWLLLAGVAVFVGSFWAGPRLSQALGG